MPDSTERLGELLVRLGAITEQQVQEILVYQKEHPEMLFGQIGIRLGFITEEKLEMFL
jgi:hypothetical protein